MSIESISISPYMTTNVRTATGSQTIRDICKIMNENNIGSVVIIKNNSAISEDSSNYKKPIGIVTERDIVKALGSKRPPSLQTLVVELMSHPLITINPHHSIKDAIQIMQSKNIRRLPIIEKVNNQDNIDKEKLVGIITDKDIFKAIMNNQSMIANYVTNGQIMLVDQQSLFGRFNESWLGDIRPK
jgi:CBS domain-containing protein